VYTKIKPSEKRLTFQSFSLGRKLTTLHYFASKENPKSLICHEKSWILTLIRSAADPYLGSGAFLTIGSGIHDPD
jgi:hypothetical protein